MKVYIDGCLKSEDEVDVTEAVGQMIYAAHGRRGTVLDGELSNIRYFAIGDSCPNTGDAGVSDISDNSSCQCLVGFHGPTCQHGAPEIPPEDPVCQNFDCAADFDRCATFDETECGGCDVSFFEPEPITLTGMQHVEAFALNGVPNFERCNGGNLKVSLKFKTSADFTTRTYQRQFFRMAQTASNNVPNGVGKAVLVCHEHVFLCNV